VYAAGIHVPPLTISISVSLACALFISIRYVLSSVCHVARPTLSAQKKVMTGLPSQFESKSNSKGSKSAGDAEFNKPTSAHNSNDMDLDIHVCVERSVVDYKDESEHSSSWVK